MSPCRHWLPNAWRRPLSPESLIALSGSAGCRSLSFPTRLFHTWHWLRRLHRAMAITNSTRLKAVLGRTRPHSSHFGLPRLTLLYTPFDHLARIHLTEQRHTHLLTHLVIHRHFS